jgi:prepilin-type N-terminal cleavage/methylation domain-containing protein
MHRRTQPARGQSLVELLVTIAIGLLLLSLVVWGAAKLWKAVRSLDTKNALTHGTT